MRHGHRAGWNLPDSYAFADSVVSSGEPWLAKTESDLTDGTVRVRFTPAKPLNAASLVWTSDSGFTGSREWNESAAQLSRDGEIWLVTADLPDIATAWFVNVRSGGLTASSDY
ncbi:MAG: hypothetical protein OXC19_20605, partial [Bryobacterales bacterium]|nr:hypothetical protein [Bryobacterales bacterium]